MTTRGRSSRVLHLAMVLLAASGCSSSEESSAADNSVATVSTGSHSTGNAGRAASKDRSGETPEQCVEETSDVFKDRTDGYGSECVSCLCEKSPSTIALCNDQADACWGLIGCVGANCAGKKDMAESDCAVAMCGQFIEGAALAMSIGVLLQGDACSAHCPAKAAGATGN